MKDQIKSLIKATEDNPKTKFEIEIYQQDSYKLWGYLCYIFDRADKRKPIHPLTITRLMRIVNRTNFDLQTIKLQIIAPVKTECLNIISEEEKHNFKFKCKITGLSVIADSVRSFIEGIEYKENGAYREFSSTGFLENFFRSLEMSSDFFVIIADHMKLRKYALEVMKKYLSYAGLSDSQLSKKVSIYTQNTTIAFILVSFGYLSNKQQYSARYGSEKGYIKHLDNCIKYEQKKSSKPKPIKG